MKFYVTFLFLIIVNIGFSLNASDQDNQNTIQNLRYKILKGIYFNKIDEGMSNYLILKNSFSNTKYQIFNPNEELLVNLCLHDFHVITNVDLLMDYFSNNVKDNYNISLPDDGLKSKYFYMAQNNEKAILDAYLLTAESVEQIEFYKLFTLWFLHYDATNEAGLVNKSTNFINTYKNSLYNRFIKSNILRMESPTFNRDKFTTKIGAGFSMFGSFNMPFNNNVGAPLGFIIGLDINYYNICFYPFLNMNFPSIIKSFYIEDTQYYANKNMIVQNYGLFLSYMIRDIKFDYVRYYPGLGFSFISYISENTENKPICKTYCYANIGLMTDLVCFRTKNDLNGVSSEMSVRMIMNLNIPLDYSRINDFNNYSMFINILMLFGPVFQEPTI